MFNLLSIKYYAIAAAALITFTAYITWQTASGHYAKKALKAEQEYTALLEERTQELLAAQTKFLNFQNNLERTYEKRTQEIFAILDAYSSRIDSGYRLLDKYAGCDPSESGVPGATQGGDGASCSRPLSREATQFLLGFAAEADRVVAQLESCQLYAEELRRSVNND